MGRVDTGKRLANMHFSLPAQLQTATSTAESEASGRMKKDVLGSIKKKLGRKSKKNV